MYRLTDSRGQGELLIFLAIIFIFSVFIAGGLFPKKFKPKPPVQVPVSASCCDNDDCSPVPGRTIDYKDQTYGLLKSNVKVSEGSHLKESGVLTSDGKPIIINTTDQVTNDCGGGGRDQLGGPTCTAIPDDQLIYVCINNCSPLSLASEYDVYFRLSDIPTPGVPEIITSCDISSVRNDLIGGKQIIITPTPDPNEPFKDLQLKAFEIQKIIQGTTPWLSPWCKPAIYLYPNETTNMSVKVNPQGKLTFAIPTYSSTDGWQVYANPNGDIVHQHSSYDYLYYEAEIPDELIEKPNEGFVVTYADLGKLFNEVLPKLSLNEKETRQFSDYWLAALPKSPYYFVGVIPIDSLNEIAPITINPPPNRMIRVTLYFEALEQPQTVASPTISPVSRNGFTAVEWGGIVKTDPSHPFSCLM